MIAPTILAAETGAELLGDAHALTAQLGRAENLAGTTPVPLSVAHLHSVPGLREFLRRYQLEVLFPFELPAIHEAFLHAARFEPRELIALDQRLAESVVSAELARASQRVGRGQLKRLRPLRDARLVQRYLVAVEAGTAHGWHTLVYGVALHVYSLPLRQGLAGYARQTLGGFISAAGDRLRLDEVQAAELLGELELVTPALIEQVLATAEPLVEAAATGLRVV